MTTDFKVAEVELSYKNTVPCKDRKKITNSLTAYHILQEVYPEGRIGYCESFKVLYLNNSLDVVACNTIAEGGITSTTVDLRLIMQGALLTNATAMVLSHNHPSGNTKPSRQDIELTERIKVAAKTLDIKVLDHIIVTTENYYSFADEGQL